MTSQPQDLVRLEWQLLNNIKASLPQLRELVEVDDNDYFYRFYHHSFKAYGLQERTAKIVAALRALLPERELNADFQTIINEGTGKVFEMSHNQRWHAEVRPILEAHHHARTMLRFAIKSGEELAEPPQWLPSEWAAVLYLYGIR